MARQKAATAMEAVRRGEYPTPWASLTEAQANAKEATARRRAAVQLQRTGRQVRQQQQARWKALEGQRHDAKVAEEIRHRMQTQGLAKHKEIDAKVQQRSAEASLQIAQQQKKEAQLQLRQQRRQQQQAQPWTELRRQEAAAAAVAKAAHNRIIPLPPDINMIEMGLNSPCLQISRSANA